MKQFEVKKTNNQAKKKNNLQKNKHVHDGLIEISSVLLLCLGYGASLPELFICFLPPKAKLKQARINSMSR